jgi:hypothetical protein
MLNQVQVIKTIRSAAMPAAIVSQSLWLLQRVADAALAVLAIRIFVRAVRTWFSTGRLSGDLKIIP